MNCMNRQSRFPGVADSEGLAEQSQPFWQVHLCQGPGKSGRSQRCDCYFWEMERGDLFLSAVTFGFSILPTLWWQQRHPTQFSRTLSSDHWSSPPPDPQTTITVAETAWPWLLSSPSTFRQQMALKLLMCETFSRVLTTALIMQHCH